jgi:hypothetical protein
MIIRRRAFLSSMARSSDFHGLSILRVSGRLFLLLVALGMNTQYQVFCIPVPWATAVLVICSIAVVLDPVLESTSPFALWVLSFLRAWAFCISLYCVVFLWELNILALLLIPAVVGFVAYVPHYFAVRICLDVKRRWAVRAVRRGFFTGLVIAVLLALVCGVWYRSASARIRSHIAGIDRQPVESMRSFMDERILGLHWKYHTQFCPYDGWRPPLHDPAVVIGYWLNGGGHRMDPPANQYLHDTIFPDQPRPDCCCAANERFW